MRASPQTDTTSSRADERVRLRTLVYDAIAAGKGYRTVVSQARWHGIGRQHMSDLRSGRQGPRLGLAMRIAEDCGVAVETIWERTTTATAAADKAGVS